MSVRHGREVLSIPGPTTVPDEVLQAMQRPAIDIYSGSLVKLTESLMTDMGNIFRTRGQTYIYAANGHGGWEAAFSNVLSRGDKVLVLESGRFALGWGEMASMMGVEIEVLPQDQRKAVDPDAVEERLKADKAHAFKAVMVVQIDTASSVVNDIAAVRKAIDRAKHPALLMVDTVASLGTMPFDMDGWGVDVAMCGSQKGLESAFKRHALLAEAVRRAVERWVQGQVLAFNIIDPAQRANSVTNVLVQDRDPQAILDYAREKCGVVLGVGIGDLTGKAFRIAHMGHVNAPMVIGTLGAVEMALKALKIPHGSGGVQAATDYLAEKVEA
jgi:aspartate aminotransferase-like enzyme